MPRVGGEKWLSALTALLHSIEWFCRKLSGSSGSWGRVCGPSVTPYRAFCRFNWPGLCWRRDSDTRLAFGSELGGNSKPLGKKRQHPARCQLLFELASMPRRWGEWFERRGNRIRQYFTADNSPPGKLTDHWRWKEELKRKIREEWKRKRSRSCCRFVINCF